MADNQGAASSEEAAENVIIIDEVINEAKVDEVIEDKEAEEPSEQTSKTTRNFKANWKKTFLWVFLKAGQMYCRSCQQVAERNFCVKESNALAHNGSKQMKLSAL